MRFKYVGGHLGKYVVFFFSFLLNCIGGQSQVKPRIVFEKTLGGSDEDILNSSLQTPDGGFLLAGGTGVYLTPEGEDLHGLSDGILIKIDNDGHKLWQKNFGGASDDGIARIIEAFDGGYLLAGSSKSDPGTGNKTSTLHSPGDFWLIKIDETGNKIWETSYGEGSLNMLQDIIKTQDGNYILAGTSRDNGQFNTGKLYDDYWIVKIDQLGNKLWSRTFGGNALEFLMCIKETSDGGFVLGGTSQSDISGDKSEGNYGLYRHDDYWIVKTDREGIIEWERTLGGETSDVASTIEEVQGGYLIGGYSYSTPSGNKTIELINSTQIDFTSDLWFVKLDMQGNMLWQKRIGGNDFDVLNRMKKSPDGNFILFGSSWSDVGYEKTSAGKGKSDMWIIKINEQAEVLWDITLGGDGDEFANDGLILSDSMFLVVGYSNSNASGDKSENNLGPEQGLRDGWVAKFEIANLYCPKIELGKDTVLCKGELLELMVDQAALAYSWNESNNQSPRTFLVDKPGRYTVEVTFEDCIVRDSIDIEYTSSFCEAIIPNVITPNGDDLNENFVVDLPDHWYINIFNRYGQSLYESFDYKNDWNGSDVPPGMYYYRVVNEKKSREFKGWLKVIK